MKEGKENYIRISAISSAFACYGTIPQAVLDKAAARGTRCHEIIFDMTNDITIPNERYDFLGVSVRPYIESFEKFWEGYKQAEILVQEERLYDDELMVTGQADLVMKLGNMNVLIDWKCTSKSAIHWKIQAGGYFHLLGKNDIHATTGLFVRLDRNGGFPEVIEYNNDREYLDWFMKAYDMYREFLQRNTCNLEDE